eukprot:CAMPEP_0113938406 /NCGR_PEP_ID=MMETSP1339-20121228/4836_1 /TAXON_ID=94617 /ORGANISM="Fibrocapsa japonica" /LENGTH=318 /DNA_ID=CAMNT_0000941503 /DNA_START=58 /DNA_END=1014 /DNA_ORIENTATION=- /assembly_acc=CAM_ASM_000762
MAKQSPYLRVCILLFCGVAALVSLKSIFSLIVPQVHLHKLIVEWEEWVEGHLLQGAVVVMLGFAMSTLMFVPGTPATVAAGMVFGRATSSSGLFLGALIASCAILLGELLGGLVAFALTRMFLRSMVLALIKRHTASSSVHPFSSAPVAQARGDCNSKSSRNCSDNGGSANVMKKGAEASLTLPNLIKALDAVVLQQGWMLVALLRLSPLFPSGSINYVLGTTGIPLPQFLMGTVGLIPGVLAYTMIGAEAGELYLGHENGDIYDHPSGKVVQSLKSGVALIGVGATIGALSLVSIKARSVLKRLLDDAGASNCEQNV